MRQTRRAKRLEEQSRAEQHRSHHSSRWREMNTQTRDEGTQDKKQRNRGLHKQQSKAKAQDTTQVKQAKQTTNERTNNIQQQEQARPHRQPYVQARPSQDQASTETTKHYKHGKVHTRTDKDNIQTTRTDTNQTYIHTYTQTVTFPEQLTVFHR
jgi:hypothetical protein